MTTHTLTKAIQRDKEDPFKSLTHLFDMPTDEQGQPVIYLNGNSLGPKPKNIDSALLSQCEKWGKLASRGHFNQTPWISYHTLVTNSLARLVGAKSDEVVAMSTLTTNIHFLFTSFYKPTPARFKIIRLAGFPSDTYAIESQVKQRLETIQAFNGQNAFKLEDAIIEIKPDENGYISIDTFKKVLEENGNETVIIWIEAVHFLTGQYFNIPEIARLAHEKGCKIGLDLAHAIGNVPLSLHAWDIDFAVWCSYKYLSAGPGAVAGLYIHEKYVTDKNITRLAGWWGNNKATRFQMLSTFDPIPTAEGWQLSNSGIFLIAALRRALDIFDQIDLIALREKNKRLVAYLEQLITEELNEKVQIITPKNPDERGCQLSLRMKQANPQIEINNLLWDKGVVCDARKDLFRVAPMGLYTTFVDVFNFVEKLKQIK